MAHILIVYATREGQTGKIARHLAAVLGSLRDVVDLVDADHSVPPPDLQEFDAAIVAAPIHISSYPRSIVRFVTEHRSLLERIPTAFLSVSLAIASRTGDGRAETQDGSVILRADCGAHGQPVLAFRVVIRE